MRPLPLLVLCTICVQYLSPVSVYAQEMGATSSGVTVQIDTSSSGTVVNIIVENSGSVLHGEEIIDQENDSYSSETGAVLPLSSIESDLHPIHSPLFIRVSELAWMGSDVSTADEWIELSAVPAFTGSVITEPVNLHGWTITIQKETGESVIVTIDHDLFIESGAYLVIANSSAGSSRLKHEPTVVSSAMSLPNTKLLLRLRDANGVVVDEVDDYVGAPFAGANPSAASGLPKASMERIDLRLSGREKTSWRTADTSHGFDDGIAMLGTPGYPNSQNLVPEVLPPPRPLVVPVISELLPDPAGTQEEWIEIANTGSTTVHLEGWSLHSGSRTFMFPAGTTLGPGEYRLFLASQTGLQLPNSGGDVQLRFSGVMFDHILYTEMPDGVSVGRHTDNLIGPYCVPTPGMTNAVIAPTIFVTGFIAGSANPASLNLEVKALSGSIAGGSCSVDYGDGFISNSCNPPSHAMKQIGNLVIKTEVKDFCGTTIIRHDPVLVEGGSRAKSTSSAPTVQRCIPTATGGLIISEFLAAPLPGNDEWIELQNVSDETVRLCGWSVDDSFGGSRPYKLDRLRVDAGQYVLIRSGDSGIALNNDADTVRLIAPDGKGGTGVVLAIPFQDAQSDRSMALRDDGILLETPFPTPGSANRFIPVDITPGSSPVILSAAMPNPVGVDEWDEWIELTNMTGRPQWLNGWHIENDSGHRFMLDGHVLRKIEVARISLFETGFSLKNTDGSIRLIDDKGVIRSVIAWKSAEEGKRIRRPQDCTQQNIDHLSKVHDGVIRGKTASGETVMLTMSGVLNIRQISGVGEALKNEYTNYVSGLIKNKIAVYKNCSDRTYSSLSVDDADLSLLLLQNGLAVADSSEASARYNEFAVYEREAQLQRRGVWNKTEDGLLAGTWKADRALDQTVMREGLTLSASPPPGLLATGSIVNVMTNVPADIWVRQGTGSYQPFDGGLLIDGDMTVTFLASYTLKTASGSQVQFSELTQFYSIRRSFYPSCMRISEVYPSPRKGESEWVELQNTCADDVSLLGWNIDDMPNTGSKPYTLDLNMVVQVEYPLILSGSLLSIALNNSGDSIVLRSPDGRIQDAMTYGKVATGKAVALVEEGYCTTIEPTIGKPNKCVQPVKKEKVPKAGKTAKSVVGLSTKYLSGLLQGDLLSTENDQFKGLMDGLNRNMVIRVNRANILPYLAGFLFLAGVGATGMGVWLYGRKYWLFQ